VDRVLSTLSLFFDDNDTDSSQKKKKRLQQKLPKSDLDDVNKTVAEAIALLQVGPTPTGRTSVAVANNGAASGEENLF
jgi:hypothetical protein